MDSQKLILNLSGENCNYISIPLKEDEKKVKNELNCFTYQAISYKDPIEYPVYYLPESRDPVPEATTANPEHLNSKIKAKLSEVRIWLQQFMCLNLGQESLI